MRTRPDKCHSEGGYKRTLIIKLPRVPCPFFPEGRKVMGEKAERREEKRIPTDPSRVSGLAGTPRTRPKKSALGLFL